MTLSKKIDYKEWFFFIGLSMMAIGLPLSKFLMTLSQFIIFGSWLLEADYGAQTKRFFKNKAAIAISSIVLIHIIGLLYTNDFKYGWEDIRKKIPLFVIPFLLASRSPLDPKFFKWLLSIFMFSVFISTVVSILVLYGIIEKQINDIREISIFISHIRLALLICMCIFVLIYFIKISNSFFHKLIWFAFIVWFVVFLVILQSATGIIILLLILFPLYLYYIFANKNNIKKMAHLVVIFIILVGLTFYLKNQFDNYFSAENTAINIAQTTSVNGALYSHYFKNNQKENGYYIWRNICWEETHHEWEKKSAIPFDGIDNRGNPISNTIIRYITSKGLYKDSLGISKISNEDVRAIENGFTNYKYNNWSSINARIYEIIWEIDSYRNGSDPNGKSASQRLEFWKAAIGIIKENPLLGVGTGDVKQAFEMQYKKTNSPLEEKWRLRSHNQFLTVAVALGIIGFSIFLIVLFYPLTISNNWKNYFFVIFMSIAFLSMTTEDTLETQAGVTFFCFFYCLFLFLQPKNFFPFEHKEEKR